MILGQDFLCSPINNLSCGIKKQIYKQIINQ